LKETAICNLDILARWCVHGDKEISITHHVVAAPTVDDEAPTLVGQVVAGDECGERRPRRIISLVVTAVALACSCGGSSVATLVGRSETALRELVTKFPTVMAADCRCGCS
jgi:hypothetical protein